MQVEWAAVAPSLCKGPARPHTQGGLANAADLPPPLAMPLCEVTASSTDPLPFGCASLHCRRLPLSFAVLPALFHHHVPPPFTAVNQVNAGAAQVTRCVLPSQLGRMRKQAIQSCRARM